MELLVNALAFALLLLLAGTPSVSSDPSVGDKVTCTLTGENNKWKCTKSDGNCGRDDAVKKLVAAGMKLISNCDTALCDSACAACNCTQWNQHFYGTGSSGQVKWQPSNLKWANCTGILQRVQTNCTYASCTITSAALEGLESSKCKSCKCVNPEGQEVLAEEHVDVPAPQPPKVQPQAQPPEQVPPQAHQPVTEPDPTDIPAAKEPQKTSPEVLKSAGETDENEAKKSEPGANPTAVQEFGTTRASGAACSGVVALHVGVVSARALA
ncbi:hypothetical protein TRVL_05602 [Trypanosoma vivax]|nr:hypothetical protein TRVL_05602 [Trypanosoma vivax]